MRMAGRRHATAANRGAAALVLTALLALLGGTPLARGESAAEAVAAETGGLLPFDAKIYELSYQIFLANRNLRDAYRIALAAVRQQPQNAEWRRRLAQVAEWSQHPEEALANWKSLAAGADDADAWDQVRRLAPALFDYRSVVEVLQRDALNDILDEQGIEQLVMAYENAGMPEEGIAFLGKLYRLRPRQIYLEKTAFLQTRLGLDEEALTTYGELAQRYGPQSRWAISAATLHILHSDVEDAYRRLSAARPSAALSDTAFWELFAAIAVYTQRTDEARDTYRELIRQNPTDASLLGHLLTLLGDHPEEALRVAEFGWRQHHDTGLLIRALELQVQLRTFKRGMELLRSLTAEQLQPLVADVRFLMARGSLYQGLGRLAEALAEYEQAMKLTPDNAQLRSLWLWLVIEMKDEKRLRRAIAVLDDTASGDMLDAVAIAHVTLGDLHGALPLMRQRLDAHLNDPVWLMDYADLLQEAGYVDTARPLRMRAKVLLQSLAGKEPRWAWPLAARLALAHSPGDPVAHIMRELLALDGRSHEIDNATADALMLWLMRSEQHDRARLWFWRRYAHALTKPAWAEFAVALIERDRPRLGEMLADEELRRLLDKYDRVQAAKVLDEPLLARELAFAALEGNPGDGALHNDLVELLPETANMAGLQAGYGERGVTEGPELRLFGRWPLTRGLTLEGSLQSSRPSVTEPGAIGDIPDTDSTLEAMLSWRHLRLSRTSVRLGVRDALTTFAYGEIAHERRFGRLHTRASLGTHLLADEGTAIRLGGRQDRLKLNLDWPVTERTFLNVELAGSLYETQEDEDLGSGQRMQVTLGHRLRVSYPDFTLRATYGLYGYDQAGAVHGKAARLAPPTETTGAGSGGQQTSAPASFFLPQDYAQYGIYLGFGDQYREDYTRRWRPFVDFGVTWNTISGLGTDISAGVGGKLVGDDHLSIAFERVAGGGGLGETDQVLWLNYRYFY